MISICIIIRVKNLRAAADLIDAADLKQAYDIASSYYYNMTVPTSKVCTDKGLDFGSN